MPESYYDRRLAAHLEPHVNVGGPLHMLVTQPGAKTFPNLPDPVQLHVQIRGHQQNDNELSVYCGLTAILNMALDATGVTFTAHKKYTDQPAWAALLNGPARRAWNEVAAVLARGEPYRTTITVDPRHVSGEGRWQAELAYHFGQATPTSAYLFDTEAKIGYLPTARTATGTLTREVVVEEVRRELAPYVEQLKGVLARNSEQMARDALTIHDGGEVDALAVNQRGNLVLVEVKNWNGENTDHSVYGAPIQLAGYARRWRKHIAAAGRATFIDTINATLDQRERLGLGHNIPRLSNTFDIQGVLAVGGDMPLSQHMRHRIARCGEAMTVQGHVFDTFDLMERVGGAWQWP